MADWEVTYLGHTPIQDATNLKQTELRDHVHAALKDVRKQKHESVSMRLSTDVVALTGHPEHGTPFYQPIGKLVYLHRFADGKMKKSHIFGLISSDEDSTTGMEDSRYSCHLFRCKSDSDSERIVFATDRTWQQFKTRGRLSQSITSMTHASEIESAIAWWNSCQNQRHHYTVSKEKIVSGVLKFQCQGDSSVKAVTKIVRLTSDLHGSPLVELLAGKFNMGDDINPAEWAVFIVPKDHSDPIIMSDDDNPIVNSLQWEDPSYADFALKKLPKGLQRVADTSRGSMSDGTSAGTLDGPGGADGLHGPVLPYAKADEDMLLSVMIKRQSGSGLGFQLTPAYLLQMCVAYNLLHQSEADVRRLLGKVGDLIVNMIKDHINNPDVLLFWSCNTLKLIKSFGLRQDLYEIYKSTCKSSLEDGVELALKSLLLCKQQETPLPSPLASANFETVPELRNVIAKYYETVDKTMSKENFQEVVDRISAAMPSPAKATPMKQRNNNNASSRDIKSEPAPKLDLDGNTTTSTAADDDGGGGDDDNTKPKDRPGIDSLPEEWEELVDQETKHRFFANHLTRQTSWTDPRDKLVTVALTKGETGLGLGISGAKRTWDNRLVLGIFVSKIMDNSAAAIDGTLREGDEILEVNGHSLIGVSREGAIDFLKQVKLGDTVILLVSQEPETWTNPANEKAALRHTAL